MAEIKTFFFTILITPKVSQVHRFGYYDFLLLPSIFLMAFSSSSRGSSSDIRSGPQYMHFTVHHLWPPPQLYAQLLLRHAWRRSPMAH